MYTLTLVVSDESPRSLLEVSFSRDAHSPARRSIRAKVCTDPAVQGTFQWSPAVRSLCLLIVAAQVDLSDLQLPGVASAKIFGGAGSPASSLDFALSKQPLWITDMFGTTAKGHSVARLLIERQNGERKMPGPVTLTLKSGAHSGCRVVSISSRRPLTPDELREFAVTLVHESIKNRPQSISIENPRSSPALPQQGSSTIPDPFRQPAWHTTFTKLYREEALTCLKVSQCNLRQGKKAPLHEQLASSTLQHLVSPLMKDLSAASERTSGYARLGIGKHQCWKNSIIELCPTLHISIPVAHVAAQLIMRGLEQKHGISTSLFTCHPHSTELADDAVSGRTPQKADLLTLNLATGGWYLPKLLACGYRPIMSMPCFTQRAQGHKTRASSQLSSGVFHFMADIPTSASMYFDELADQRIINKKKFSVEETDLSDIHDILSQQSNGARIISPFPFYRLYEMYDLDYVDSPLQAATHGLRPTVLFASERIHSAPHVLEAIIGLLTDTWFELSEGNALFTLTINDAVNDATYLRVLARIAGLHHHDVEPLRSQDPPKSWLQAA